MKKLIGTWIAEDGSTIELSGDGTFTCSELPTGYANDYLISDVNDVSI